MTQITAIDVSVQAEVWFGLLRPFQLLHLPMCTRKFKAHFGVDVFVVAHLWNLIDTNLGDIPTDQVYWLLAALYFLHVYPTMDVISSRLEKHPDTVRTHVWVCVNKLASLDCVSECVAAFRCKSYR